ncbi:MAG: efflux RND transporter periplasmic adaptor subunit [Bacteroidota bacterium]|nr:efflux RND transporter periplasmic adaptor subunit [Bacteroidota bacterium]
MSEKRFDLSKLKISREENPPSGPESPPSRPHIAYFLYIGAALFIGFGIYFFLINIIKSDEIVEVTTVVQISPAQADAILTASGYIVAQRKASVASKATGRLVYLGFKEGDQVQKGEIIARIESEDVEAALAQAKAELEVANADKIDAEQSLERAQKLFEPQLISQAEYDGVKARYDRVAAIIASRKAAVKAAEVQLENTLIRAPFDGTILTKNADVGEVVAPFSAGASSRVAVVTLADMRSLQVEADVSESNIERIDTQQPCEIILDAYPDKRYRGFVDKIIPTADRAKATVLTKIRFADIDHRVLPEMSAKVHFLKKQSTDSIDVKLILAVEREAITKRKNEEVVFLLDKRIVHEIPVTLGNTYGKMIEIKSGLSHGDKIILRPSYKLQSGTSVKVKD